MLERLKRDSSEEEKCSERQSPRLGADEFMLRSSRARLRDLASGCPCSRVIGLSVSLSWMSAPPFNKGWRFIASVLSLCNLDIIIVYVLCHQLIVDRHMLLVTKLRLRYCTFEELLTAMPGGCRSTIALQSCPGSFTVTRFDVFVSRCRLCSRVSSFCCNITSIVESAWNKRQCKPGFHSVGVQLISVVLTHRPGDTRK
jgi:hypothetical protein